MAVISVSVVSKNLSKYQSTQEIEIQITVTSSAYQKQRTLGSGLSTPLPICFPILEIRPNVIVDAHAARGLYIVDQAINLQPERKKVSTDPGRGDRHRHIAYR